MKNTQKIIGIIQTINGERRSIPLNSRQRSIQNMFLSIYGRELNLIGKTLIEHDNDTVYFLSLSCLTPSEAYEYAQSLLSQEKKNFFYNKLSFYEKHFLKLLLGTTILIVSLFIYKFRQNTFIKKK